MALVSLDTLTLCVPLSVVWPCGFSGETEEWELMFDDMAGLKKYLAQARKSRIGAEVELARHVSALPSSCCCLRPSRRLCSR